MSDEKVTNLVPINNPGKVIRRIDPNLLTNSAIYGKAPPMSPFKPPSFPPMVEQAVKESGLPTLAMDQFASAVFGWAGTDTVYNAYAEGIVFLGYSYLATLAQRAEYRVVTETIASEMTREWIELKIASGDETKTDKKKQIEDELDKLNVRHAFRKVAESDGFFGRGHLYLDTGMTEDADELLTDLGDGRNMMSRLKIGPEKSQRLIAVRPVEATWCYPTHYESVDPLKRDWYAPVTWYVMSREIHRSRLMTFIGREVPDILKPAYAFGGLSMSQMLKPYVDNWLRTRQSVSDLIQNFSHMILKTNMDATTQVGGEQILGRVAVFNNVKNNQGTIVIDKDTEDFANVSAPIGGLDHLQAQAQEHMAAIARIPLVKLLGIQPAGLNASSEGELISFEDWIAAFQEALFRKPLTTIIDLIQLSLWGEIDDEIVFDFLPLRQLNPTEKAQLEATIAQTRELYTQIGAVDAEEVREALANDPDTPFDGVDMDKPLPPPPGMPGMPPMPGAPGAGGPPGSGGPPGGAGGGGPPSGPGSGNPPPADKLQQPRFEVKQAANDAEFKEGDHPRDESGQFTSGGGEATAKTKIPLKLTDYPLEEILRDRDASYPPSARVSQEVPVDKLEASQGQYDQNKLKVVSRDPIEVIKFKGHYIVDDGHHRAVRAKNEGKDKINAHVLDLDLPENRRFISSSWRTANDADFKESDHPRDDDGKFTSGSGGGKSSSPFDAKKYGVETATHFAPPERAHQLLSGTPDLSKSGPQTWQGSGLYLYPGEGPTGASVFGEEKLTIKPNLKNPFIGTSEEVEKKVDELKKTLEPPLFKMPDGSTVTLPDGQPLRLWNKEQSEGDALRQAWLKAGHDGLLEDRGGGSYVLAIFDPEAVGQVSKAEAKTEVKTESKPEVKKSDPNVLPDWIKTNLQHSGLSGPAARSGGNSWDSELEARGATPEAVAEMRKLFEGHKIGEHHQAKADKELAEAVNSDSDLGKALRLQMDLEDQIFHHWEENKVKRVEEFEKRAKDELKWMWENGMGNEHAYDNMEEQWQAEKAHEYKKMKEPMRFYRKGELDKDVVPTSHNSKGAQAHSVTGAHQPHYAPNRNHTYQEMKDAGYRILGGLGYNQMGYSGEDEVTWIKPSKKQAQDHALLELLDTPWGTPAFDADFVEEDHPRGEGGKFVSKGEGGGGGKQEEEPQASVGGRFVPSMFAMQMLKPAGFKPVEGEQGVLKTESGHKIEFIAPPKEGQISSYDFKFTHKDGTVTEGKGGKALQAILDRIKDEPSTPEPPKKTKEEEEEDEILHPTKPPATAVHPDVHNELVDYGFKFSKRIISNDAADRQFRYSVYENEHGDTIKIMEPKGQGENPGPYAYFWKFNKKEWGETRDASGWGNNWTEEIKGRPGYEEAKKKRDERRLSETKRKMDEARAVRARKWPKIYGMIKDLSAKYDYPEELVTVYNTKEHSFKGRVGRRTFIAAGQAYQDGRITINGGSQLNYENNTREAAGVLAHEIFHQKQNRAEEHDPTVKDYIKENFQKLRATDGVTKYSKDWWQAYERDPNNPTNVRGAINETLAEMAFLHERAAQYGAGLGGMTVKKYRQIRDEAQDAFAEAGIALDLKWGARGEPDEFSLRKWGSDVNSPSSKIDPDTLDPELKKHWETLTGAAKELAAKPFTAFDPDIFKVPDFHQDWVDLYEHINTVYRQHRGEKALKTTGPVQVET